MRRRVTRAPGWATARHRPTPITARPAVAAGMECMKVVMASSAPTTTRTAPTQGLAARRCQTGRCDGFGGGGT